MEQRLQSLLLVFRYEISSQERAGRTCDTEVTNEFIRVGRPQPIYEIDIGELGANARCAEDRFEFVETTRKLQRLRIRLLLHVFVHHGVLRVICYWHRFSQRSSLKAVGQL